MDPEVHTWKDLLVDYTENTTCHGMRYLTLDHKRLKCLRRLTWSVIISVAVLAFSYLFSIKLFTYFQYAVNVNMEVKYSDAMDFPAVTICNQNKYRLTTLQQQGMYDVNKVMLLPSHTSEQKLTSKLSKDQYFYLEKICNIPTDVVWSTTFINMTRQACASLCSIEYTYNCSSILYNRASQSCDLASYTGSRTLAEMATYDACHPKGPTEFYVRSRHHAWDIIFCTFESGSTCPFAVENQFGEKRDEFLITQTKTSFPSQDLTIQSGDGHYLLFSETSLRPGFRASFASPFMNTTGKCLTFYFRFLGHTSSVAVLVRDPELGEFRLSDVSWKEPSDRPDFGGTYYEQPLPAGEYQVIIQAERNSDKTVSTGCILDNVFIMECAPLNHLSCMRTQTGIDYIGTESVSASGKTCLSWSDKRVQLMGFYTENLLPDMSLRKARNYCRNPGNSGKKWPFCYVVNGLGFVQKEDCKIHYCECLNLENDFKCDSGFCIPKALECDGVDHCGDNSDETRNCDLQILQTCGFDSAFICGYRKDDSMKLKWSWHRNGMLALNNDPLQDADGKSLGYYLLIDSRGIEPGDKAVIQTPFSTLSGVINIKFSFYTNFILKDILGKLSVYVVGSHRRRLIEMFEYVGNTYVNGDQRGWNSISLCLHFPGGKYAFEFEGTLGTSFQTVIALDSVHITPRLNECNTNTTLIQVHEVSSFHTCSFSLDEDCNYSLRTWNYWIQWRLLPAVYISTVINNPKTTVPSVIKDDPQYCQDAPVEKIEFRDNYYSFYLEYAYFYRSLYYEDNDQFSDKTERTCSLDLYDLHGLIQSPLYPSNYMQGIKVFYKIQSSVVTNITLETKYFNTELLWDFLKVDASVDGNSTIPREPFSFSKTNLWSGSSERHFKVEMDTMQLRFNSDFNSPNIAEGYTIEYNMEQQPNEDYVVAMANRGYTQNNVIMTNVDMDTPVMISYNTNACLTFRALVATKLSIYIESCDGSILLHQIYQVPYWQKYEFDITPHPSEYFIRFRGSASNYGSLYVRYFVFLDDISIDPQPCFRNEVKESLSCNFESDTCGYHDISIQTSPWKHVNWSDIILGNAHMLKIYNGTFSDDVDMVLLVTFASGNETQKVALLQSPTITIESEQCVTLNMYCDCDSGSFIRVFDNDRVNLLTSLPRHTWFNYSFNLSAGQHTIKFEATIMPSGIDDMTFQYFVINHINLTEGYCQSYDQPYNHMEYTIEIENNVEEVDTESTLVHNDYPITFNSGGLQVSLLRPELGDIHVMIKNITDLSMRDMDIINSHHIDNMLLKCTWNSFPCSTRDFQPTPTELGICYTFNHNGSKPRTMETGSGSGLEILLNAEKYEHTAGFNNNAGFKIFIHDPSEIAYIKYVGTAVATGMSALLPITLDKFERLGGNYGKCTGIPNELYPGEPYSLYRCKKSMNAHNMYNICGCKMPEMPGNYRVCNVEEFIDCAYQTSIDPVVNNTNMEVNQICEVACKSKRFSAQVSWGRLSDMNSELYLQDHTESIQANFVSAMELRNRIDSFMLLAFLDPYNQLLGNYTKLQQTLMFNVMDKSTAVTGLIKDTLDLIQKHALEDLKEGLLIHVGQLDDTYNLKLRGYFNAVLQPFEDLLRYLHTFGSILNHFNEYMLPSDDSRKLAMSTIDTILELIPLCQQSLQMINPDHELYPNRSSNFFYAHNYTINNICTSTKDYYHQQRIVKHLDKIKSLTGSLKEIYNSNVTYNSTDIQDNKTALLENFKELEKVFISEFKIKCVQGYELFLKDITQFISTFNTIQLVTINTNDINEELLVLNNNFNTLSGIYSLYISGQINKVEVATNMSDKNLDDWMQQVDLIYTTVDATSLQVLDEYIRDVYTNLLRWYNLSVPYAVELGKYWKNNASYLQSEAENIRLWKKPMPNFKTAELIQYELSSITRSWPSTLNLDQFTSTFLKFMVETRLDSFFSQLKEEISQLQLEISSIITDIRNAQSLIEDEINRYMESIKIDGDFVKENFASINVFYGELRYSLIKDLVAYDGASFFSDVGGYMGLLIGMSAITLVEVIDLVLYSTIVKCIKKFKSKHTTVETLESVAVVKPNTNMNHHHTNGTNENILSYNMYNSEAISKDNDHKLAWM